jgi:hypothetical protein
LLSARHRLDTSELGHPLSQLRSPVYYSQLILWERCLRLVDSSFDLILKARPDLFFLPHTTSLGWSARCAHTGQPLVTLFDQPLVVTNASIFTFISPFVAGGIDDIMLLGNSAAMRRAVGALKHHVDTASANGRNSTEWHLYSLETLTIEETLRFHVERSQLAIYCMGGRRLFTKLETCQRCLLPDGRGFRYGTFGSAFRGNVTWLTADRAIPIGYEPAGTSQWMTPSTHIVKQIN